MIQRFSFGSMIPTDSVVQVLPVCDGPVPYLQGDAAGWQYVMAPADAVYGLGETVRGINKRGWHYRSFCTDEPHHTEEKQSLYGAHNFFVVSGAQTFGVFIDFGGVVEYDVGYTRTDLLRVTVAEPNYDLYLITGGSVEEICRQFRGLVGRSYIPPKWAFGFGQSRWGYRNEADVRAVADGYQNNGLPIDMIYMDIDYMDGFADFTVSGERFPDLPGLAAEMKQRGIRLVPIIDAGVKADPADPTYAEGLARGYFVTKEDGTPFVGAVWPGHACFPDFLRPEVRDWFGHRYKLLTDMGIEGFWNDMNEPAIFYSTDGLAKAIAKVESHKGQNLDLYAFFSIKDAMLNTANSPADYASFYHQVGQQRVRHDRVHNLYGYNMTRAAGEAFADLRPGKRTLMFSRASLIGAHRYGGIWLGDNSAWWSHLAMNVKQMPGVQMAGFLFTGADLGGFGCDTTPDLVLRWMEFGVFSPLLRNHSAMGTREQEFYQFEPLIPAFRKLLGLRYALLPYIYSEFMKAALQDGLYFRPLAFAFPEDPIAREVEDQLLLGDEAMIAPVVTQNATGRVVYLPEPMKLYRLRSAEDYDTQLLPAGHHYLSCQLDELLLFVRPGKVIPVAKPAANAAAVSTEELTFWQNLAEGETGAYLLYDDDGETTDYDRPEHWNILVCEG